MSELFLFVRPPRPVWPFNGPSTRFWPPLAFASLAAALREALPDLRVGILDAPALRRGWKSLTADLHELQPAYVGIGEEAVSAADGLRLAGLARAAGAKVVAGGCFFGQVAPQLLATGLVEAVVHGEGERTIVELVCALRTGQRGALRAVRGISFRAGEETVCTGHRPLIADLDDLPFPAYDLLPVAAYGGKSRNHPNLAAIELGRGCTEACDFCVLWRQMGQPHGSGLVPRLRVKSAARLLEEIRVLRRRHGRRYLGWVDPTFNAHPTVPAELAELLCREGLQTGQSAWVRADHLRRDHDSGALAAGVRAGLNEVYVGVERSDAAGLAGFHKGEDLDAIRDAFNLVRRHHPRVFTVGSFIYGLPGDSPQTMRDLHQLSLDLGVDQAFFIPLTPLPGTPFWQDTLWDPTGEFFRSYSFLPQGVNGTANLDRALMRRMAFYWPGSRIGGNLRRLFLEGPRKRRMTVRLVVRGLKFAVDLMLNQTPDRNSRGLVMPAWVED
jgi:anaerobic magnesium-protoporphyrin IX monomethyl ester cyclase